LLLFRKKGEQNGGRTARALNSTAKSLHPHMTGLGFPAQLNDKLLTLSGEEEEF
jgi:hypothetical protein